MTCKCCYCKALAARPAVTVTLIPPPVNIDELIELLIRKLKQKGIIQ